MAETEVLTEVYLPWSRPYELVREFKQAHRRDDDIAIVNAGMRALLAEGPSGILIWLSWPKDLPVS
jgi:xanthine dehydrogenase/oxidase